MRTRDENKEHTLRQKAIEMIVREGLDGLSMQRLAKAANISPATIYIYFKDREDLIVKVCSEVGHHMMEYSLTNFSPDMPFDEGLKVQWLNRANYFKKYPIEVQFLEQLKYSPLYDKVTQELYKNFREVLGQFVHNAINRKELVSLPFEVYWSMAFAPLYQLIKFHSLERSYVNKPFVLTDEMLMQTLHLVLKALKP